MLILAIAALFVIGGLNIRRHYGGTALAGLWIVTTLVMASTSSAGLLLLLARFGTTPVPAAGRALAFAFMLLVNGASFGGAAIAIQKTRTGEGPWLTAPGILWGMVGFVAGGAIAYGLVVAAIVLGLAGMAK